MFDIDDKYRTFSSDLVIISDNFHVFHYDEFPILFAGTNYLGNKIIASLVCEDEDGDVFRHFYFIVTNKQYNDFVKKKLSYKMLILSISNVFVIDKDINGSTLNIYYVPVNTLPIEYLPLENVFCPNVERAIGFDYTISLQGGLADIHEAFSATISSIGKSANSILNNLSNALKIKLLNPQVHQLPSIEGSFELKFRVKVDDSGLFYKEEYLKNYFQLCLDYTINKLPNEAKQLAIGEVSDTFFEREILPSARAVYESFSYKMEDSQIEELTTKFLDIIGDVEDIGVQVGKGFSAIEFLGSTSENKDVSIGYIDKEYADDIRTINQDISTLPKKGEIVVDDYQEYRILIYDFNTDTRTGTAHIGNIANADIMDNPKIRVEGDGDLTESIFTESLHFNKWIFVKAKARLMNDRFKQLSVQFAD